MFCFPRICGLLCVLSCPRAKSRQGTNMTSITTPTPTAVLFKLLSPNCCFRSNCISPSVSIFCYSLQLIASCIFLVFFPFYHFVIAYRSTAAVAFLCFVCCLAFFCFPSLPGTTHASALFFLFARSTSASTPWRAPWEVLA